MNAKLRQQLRQRKRKMQRRIDKANWSGRSPMIQPSAIKYELADKQQAISAGGIGTLMQLTKTLGVRQEINAAVPLFKLYLPYDETDQVLNMALNLVAGANAWSTSKIDAAMKRTSMPWEPSGFLIRPLLVISAGDLMRGTSCN